MEDCKMCEGTGIYQDMNQTYTEKCEFCKGTGKKIPSPPGLSNRIKGIR